MHLFVRTLHHGCFPVHIESETTVAQLKQHIESVCHIPAPLQRLRCGRHDIVEGIVNGLESGSTVCLLLRLMGGKGGFGSLLRVQGRDTKATTNFDACRDLNGRRLRDVTSGKKLEEWQKGAKDRALEDIALKHLAEEAKRRKKELNPAIDPDIVSHLQKEAISNVKDAVQSAIKLRNPRGKEYRKSKKARFQYDSPSSSDEGTDSEESWPEVYRNKKGLGKRKREILANQDDSHSQIYHHHRHQDSVKEKLMKH